MTPPMPASPRLSIAGILEPRRVAVFGASDDRGKWAGRIMYYLALHGYAGEVVPINPRREIVQGKRCYARIGDAPNIDVAVIAIPAGKVPETIRDCAEAGVGCCLVISSGFAEIGAAGAALQQEIVEIARAAGMRLIGPNCLGLINLRNGMALTSARVLEVEKLIQGAIGLVTQSGALMLSIFNRAYDAGIGFSQLVSVGNQADLDLCDFFEHMIADPATEVVCLHIEGLKDGRRFLALARRARQAGKPVVALKTGRSALGQEAARSHTASLAGAFSAFAAACRDTGIVLVDDPDVMVLTAAMLQRFGPCPAGGIGIVSSSGGIAGIIVDRLADIGAPLARFAPETEDRLRAILLPSHVVNPIDLGARRPETGETDAVAGEAVRAVAADPGVGLVMVPLTTAPNYEATATALASALAQCGKPGLIVLTPGSVAAPIRTLIKEAACPLYDRIDDAMRMLRAYRAYAPPAPHRPSAPPQIPVRPMPITQRGYLTEPEAKALLADYGIPVTREAVVRTAAEAKAAAAAIGYPVVLKGVSRRVVHKSDAGLVRLGIAGPDALERAWAELGDRLRAADPEAGALLLAEMAAGEAELILGAKRDPQFGPVVLAGAGGVFVELMQDVETALAPIDEAGAEALLQRLRIWPLFAGFRGRPPLDAAAAAQALVRLGALAADLGERLGEIDINPLIVRPAGRGVVAADARAMLF
ncbi:MAG TPA: acetate--CoA ligase family protein [Stellaceae bacterium]|nr:acetate--CoA ligase family protein [Stellaceae bacterium]